MEVKLVMSIGRLIIEIKGKIAKARDKSKEGR